MRGISDLTSREVHEWPTTRQKIEVFDGIYVETWVLARPEGLTSIKWRFKMAWKVFTGKADVLIWEEL